MIYATIQHPTTGATYAVGLSRQCKIVAASGPLYPDDALDNQALAEYIRDGGNDSAANAEWLTEEIVANPGQ